jgi:DNA repair ATPase RecN
MKQKRDHFDKQLSRLDDAEQKIKSMNNDLTHLVQDYGKDSREKQRNKQARNLQSKTKDSEVSYFE